MTVFSAFGILLSIAALALVWTPVTVSRLAICLALLVFHIGASIAYYSYSLTHTADSIDYYYNTLRSATDTFAFSTTGLTNFVQLLRNGGATYFDCFMIFQSFGFAGLMLLAKTFKEMEDRLLVPDRQLYLLLLFLPTLNFWTAAIGKDAPVFFAVSLCVWSMLSLRKRLVFFCIALGIMVVIRAHVALMAATALAGAALFERSMSAGRKLGLLAVALVGMWLTSGAVTTSLGVDPTSVSSVSSFLSDTNSTNATIGGNTAMGDAPYPLRVASLLFRPLFFDAQGGMDVIVSFENVGVVLAFIYALAHWRDVMHLARRVVFIRFILFFAFIVLFGLTLVYYNVGLGLRERIMAYPMVLSSLVALWSIRRKRTERPVAPIDRNLLVGGNRNRAVPEL